MEAARNNINVRITTSPMWGTMSCVLTNGADKSRLTTGVDTTAILIEGVWPVKRFELSNATWGKSIPATLPSRWCIFDPVRHFVPATVASVMPIPTDTIGSHYFHQTDRALSTVLRHPRKHVSVNAGIIDLGGCVSTTDLFNAADNSLSYINPKYRVLDFIFGALTTNDKG
eukprot:5201184-Heterocapsa_arctica.AAC.1